MAGEWRAVRLGELGEVNRGRSRHRPRNAPHLYGGAYPFIQTGDIKASNGLITGHTQTYSEAGLAQSRLWPAGTMVITIAANIAETAILTYPACFPDSVVGFIADKQKADVRFIEYLFRHLRRQIQHENVGTGSVQDNINLQTLDRLALSVPELPEQRAIAHILGTLDDKIELNRRRNQTLEAMARALFKDWFVDFGPVRAKMEPPSPSGRGAGGEGSNPQPRRKPPLPDTIRRHAVKLRRNATDAENLMWRLLRNQQLANAKFRRQHAVPPYILDFYCHELKLAVEFDGGQHNEPAGRAHDDRRTAYLQARGIEVLRFWNHDVLRQTEAVLEAIYQAIEARRGLAPSPPAPLPEGEGSKACFGTDGEGSAAGIVAKAVANTTHPAVADALKPFSPREKGWNEGAYLPPDLWNLFPDRLDDEGKPEGWEMVPASELIEFNPTEPLHKGTPAPYLDMASLSTSGSWPEAPVMRDFGSGMRFRNGDTLLARITPCLENGKTAFVQCLPDDTVGWGSTEYIVMRPKAPVPAGYAYLLARDDAFREHAIRSMTGTSGRQRAQGDSVAAFKVATPLDEEVWCAFAKQVAPIFESIKSNAQANETLAQLRDTLLPKLISGELRISDAEKFMERMA